ncbi:hypothetical protein B9Q11_00485 [Candidatus Marsarchaeota G2 archaeon ECH_B_SAG-F08]|uniref:DUF1156 domain-containing protein n=1 Tax=Candidatus Marsarchaeota G2 archaeon ECH_B_SAG-F08 TaxID=1978165 RepID=A0A2R6BML9_9ARCH|nr:MAG: hypothetical protein B9Q11_00485 [Candidatus Marsarchaeota G2 archaeon ECH_B_SAG-F08]
MDKMKKTLIEKWFPISEINRDAAIEIAYKAVAAYIKHCRELGIPEHIIKKIGRNFFDPKIRSLHPWFARRPCSISRALTLGAIFPEQIDAKTFMQALGWDNKTRECTEANHPPLLFYANPDKDLIRKILLRDSKKPEDIVVCDPMAGGGSIPLESLRLGFKSIAIDYNPVAYLILKGTVEYPSVFGKELAKLANEEFIELILFAQNELGRFYPKDAEGYIIARGIKCKKCGGKIPLIQNAQVSDDVYILLQFNSKEFNIALTKQPTKLPYETSKRGLIKCPYCSNPITKKDAYTEWTNAHVEILENLKNGNVDSDKIFSTYVLLIRQTGKKYVVCDANDNNLFLDACKELSKKFNDLENFLFLNEIPTENDVFYALRQYGIKHWYELFNPRQLLAIGTLIRYARKKAEALLPLGKLGAALSLYLSFGVSKLADYNCIFTSWKNGTIRDGIGSYAQSRKISYSEWFCEAIVPYRNLRWIFEPKTKDVIKTEGGIYPILEELCNSIGGLGENIKIVNGDSRLLSSLLGSIKVDVINVDPPYYDTHIYSDISEFFWQVFRLILVPYIGSEFTSYHPDWCLKSEKVPRSGEIIVRSNESTTSFNKERFTQEMSIFLKECHKVLKDDGVLILWFTHKSFSAWETIIQALITSQFYVSRVWPVTSELLTRLVAKRNNSSLNKTLVIVARKKRNAVMETDLAKSVEQMLNEMNDALSQADATKTEIITFLKAVAICAVTRVETTEHSIKELISQANKIAEKKIPALLEENSRKRKNTLLDFF